MAGRFTEQFSQQLGSLSSFRMPQQERSRMLTPEEIRIQKANADLLELELQNKKYQELASIAQQQGISKGMEQLGDTAGQMINQPVGVLSPLELDRQENQRMLSDWKVLNSMVPPEKRVSFDDFVSSKKSKELELKAKEADIAKQLAGKPPKLGLTSDQLRMLEVANESGDYETAYETLKSDGVVGLPKPQQSKENIAKQLMGSKSYTYESDVAQAMASGEQAKAKIEDFGSYATIKDEKGKEIRLDKRLNSENKEDVSDLRNNFKSEIKPFSKALSEIDLTKKNLANRDSSGGIQGLNAVNAIYRHMKGLDESGAVREGDIALFLQSLGLADVVEGKIASWKGGTYLNKDIVDSIDQWISNQEKSTNKQINSIKNSTRENAIFRGLHPKLIDSSIPIDELKDIEDKAQNKNQVIPLSSQANQGDPKRAKRIQ